MTDKEKDIQTNQEEDFAALLEQYEADTLTQVELGEKVTGKVVHRSKENLHVNIGTRSEAIMSLEDPRTESIDIGDEVTAYVEKTDGEIVLNLDPIVGHGDYSTIQQAHYAEEGLEGTVIGVNKGGFEINIAGTKCFCPISQLDLSRIETPEKWIGTTREFKIIELDERGKSAVVSHRQLIVDEENRKRDELRARIHEGVKLTGKVAEIMKYGAFIDLGGLRGLLHISEIAHYKVNKVEDILQLNQDVEVQVVQIEKDEKGRERFKLSRKALIPNPWEIREFEEGQTLKGTPLRTAPFGVFVKIEEGIEGLIPKRLLKQAGKQIDIEEVELHTEAEFIVVECNKNEQKLTLAYPGWDEKPQSHLKVGEKLKAEVVKVIQAGVLVQALEDPARGLLPKRFLENMNHKKMVAGFPVGKELDLVLESIDDKGRYTFETLNKKNDVDTQTLEKYSDQASIAHNPFADFFKK
ncbi:MAG: hypothetical protein CR997_04115 [Acidobacteria bacterium]|nr:MAG: hypothetical protein CR997_04115 [Acidobacteriota bacterium]